MLQHPARLLTILLPCLCASLTLAEDHLTLVPQLGYRRMIDYAMTRDEKRLVVVNDSAIVTWDIASGLTRNNAPAEEGFGVRALFSPDRASVWVTNATDGKIVSVLLDVATGRQIRALPFEIGYLSPDGQHGWRTDVYTGTPEKPLIAENEITSDFSWVNMSSGEVEKAYTGIPGYVFAISPDGKKAVLQVCLARDNTLAPSILKLVLWDLTSGKELMPIGSPNEYGYTGFSFNEDGSLLAAVKVGRIFNDVHSILIWDTATGELRQTLQGAIYPHGISFSPDGRLIAASGDNIAYVWDLSTGRLVRQVAAEKCRRVTFTADSKCILTDTNHWANGSEDTKFYIWDINSGDCLHTLEPYLRTLSLNSMTASNTGLVACEGENALVVIDLPNGEIRTIPLQPGNWIHRLVCSPDGKVLAALLASDGDTSTSLHVWNLDSGKESMPLKTRPPFGATLAFSPDASLLVVSDDAKHLVVLHTDSMEIEESGVSLEGFMYSTVFISYDAFAICDNRGSKEGTYPNRITVWSLPEKKICWQQTAQPNYTFDRIQTIPDTPWLAAQMRKLPRHGEATDISLVLYNIESGLEFKRIQIPAEGGYFISADGKRLATYTRQSTAVTWWDTETWDTRTASFPSGMESNNIALFDDGILVTRQEDGAIKFWRTDDLERSDAQPLATLFLMQDNTWFVFTPDGHWDGSELAPLSIAWRQGDMVYPFPKYGEQMHRPGLLKQILPPANCAQNNNGRGSPPARCHL